MIPVKLKIRKFCFAAFLFLIFWVAASIASAQYVHCYNKSEKRLYFTPYSQIATTKAKSPSRCTGRTFYTEPNGMVYDVEDPNGAGDTEQMMRLNNRRQLLISSWNSYSQVNTLIVLEPDFKNNVVRELCRLDNYSDLFTAKVDTAKNTLMILIREPADINQTTFRQSWKSCPL